MEGGTVDGIVRQVVDCLVVERDGWIVDWRGESPRMLHTPAVRVVARAQSCSEAANRTRSCSSRRSGQAARLVHLGCIGLARCFTHRSLRILETLGYVGLKPYDPASSMNE